MSHWLDERRDLLGLVARDLGRHGVRATGRQGLPAEAVLRCALLKQYRQLTYQELAFHLEDSASFRAFARLPWSWSPRKSVLQKTISAVPARDLGRDQSGAAVECPPGKTGRWCGRAAGQHCDLGTHARPSDSSLLWDAVRVMVRLLKPG